MNCRSEGSSTAYNSACRCTSEDMRSGCQRTSFWQYRATTTERHYNTGQLTTFDMLPNDVLPNDVLLKIFDFHLENNMDEDVVEKRRIEEWITLAHVCRRWRSVVFYSPRRLNLRLVCTPETARDTLDNWPPLPLIVRDGYRKGTSDMAPVDNSIAALEHNDRVRQIDLGGDSLYSGSQLAFLANSVAMQKPFPELIHLRLYGPRVRSIPDTFLGGTAPRLQSLELSAIRFPGLPKLLLSATHLIHLDLDITYNYIPPEALATGLSALTNLESLRIRVLPYLLALLFPKLESQRPPPPLTRTILPSLTKIEFDRSGQYVEEILARIDAPQLNKMHITYLHDREYETTFDTPQLFQLISRSPALMAPEKCLIIFDSEAIVFKFLSRTFDCGELIVEILCAVGSEEWEYYSVEQNWFLSLPPVPALKDLYIFEDRVHPPEWQDDDRLRLDFYFLGSFIAVKNLFLSEEAVTRIAPALQQLVGGGFGLAEVFPILENIFLEGFHPSGSLHEDMEKLVAARRLTSQPVTVSLWDEDSIQEEERQLEI